MEEVGPGFLKLSRHDEYGWEVHVVLSVRYGLVVRIPGSHPGGPGSIPGNANLFVVMSFKSLARKRMGFKPTP